MKFEHRHDRAAGTDVGTFERWKVGTLKKSLSKVGGVEGYPGVEKERVRMVKKMGEIGAIWSNQ